MKAKQLIYLTILLLLIISCQSHLFRQESSDKMVFKKMLIRIQGKVFP